MLIWYGFGVILAVLVAWLAAVVHASGHAPLGLVSLGVGIALGAALAGIAATLQLACFRRLMFGTLVLAIVAVFAEHAWLYLDFRRQWHESRRSSAAVAMFRSETPPSLQEYLHLEWSPQRAAVWCVDAVLVVAGAAATVFALRREKKLIRPGGRR
jgi:hypothetical protein